MILYARVHERCSHTDKNAQGEKHSHNHTDTYTCLIIMFPLPNFRSSGVFPRQAD